MLTTDFHTNLAVQRPELTEVIVGPIGQTTFAGTVLGLLTQLNLPPFLLPIFLNLFDGVVELANGGPGTILGSAPDAFSYTVVEVFEDAGQPRLRVTERRDGPGVVIGIASAHLFEVVRQSWAGAARRVKTAHCSRARRPASAECRCRLGHENIRNLLKSDK